MKSTRLLLCLSPVALLAACGDSPSAEEGAATGEVLEGTISDAMLPLDRVRSQAPLAPRQQSATPGESEDQADGAEAEGGEEGEAAPADQPEAVEVDDAQG